MNGSTAPRKCWDFDLIAFISLLLVLTVPSFVFVALEVNSLALGLVMCSLVVISLNYTRLTKLTLSVSMTVCFLVALGMVTGLAGYSAIYVDEVKPIASITLLLVVVLAAVSLGIRLAYADYRTLENIVLLILAILVVLGWIKLAYMPDFFNYELREKPVFPFSEESHYGLALSMFAITYAVVGRAIISVVIAMNLIAMAILYPNLTILLSAVGVSFGTLLRVRRSNLSVAAGVGLVLSGALVWGLSQGSGYFGERLSLGSENVTSLVYLQGWSMAYLNLMQNGGFGIGFQMLGTEATIVSPYLDDIVRISGTHLNSFDGGFLAAKVIAEFGFLGLVVSVLYVMFIIRFIFYANAAWSRIRSLKGDPQALLVKKYLMMNAFLLSFAVEFFFRGYGYFSPGVFLVVMALTARSHIKVAAKQAVL